MANRIFVARDEEIVSSFARNRRIGPLSKTALKLHAVSFHATALLKPN